MDDGAGGKKKGKDNEGEGDSGGAALDKLRKKDLDLDKI